MQMAASTEKAIDKLMRNGDTKAAVAYLRATGGGDAAQLDVVLQLIQLCVQNKDSESRAAATELLRRMEIAQEDLPRVANSLLAAGAHQAALECIERLEPEQRDRFGVLELRARAFRGLGQNADAEDVYRRMGELYPFAPKTWTSAASFFRAIKNNEMEAHALTQALKLSLKDTTILKRLALLRVVRGDKRGAIALWQQVLRIDPSDQEAAFGVLDKLTKVKDWRGAAAWLESRRELLPAGEQLDALAALIAQNAPAAEDVAEPAERPGQD